MSYLSILLGLFTAFCWGTSDYLSRSSSAKVGPYRTTVYMHVFSILTIILLIPVLKPDFSFPPLVLVIFLAIGLINFFAFISLYRGFHLGVVSVVAPIAYSYPAVTTALAFILFGTVLSRLKLLALISVMIGVMLLSTKLSELRNYGRNGKLNIAPGAGYAAIAATSFGLVYTGLGLVTSMVGYVLPAIFLRILGGLYGFLFAPLLKESVRPERKLLTPSIIIMGILETLGLLSFTLGFSLDMNSLPIVTALSGMGGAFATSYALIFLRERLELNQIAGILLSIVGVFVLLYFSR